MKAMKIPIFIKAWGLGAFGGVVLIFVLPWPVNLVVAVYFYMLLSALGWNWDEMEKARQKWEKARNVKIARENWKLRCPE